VPPQREPPRVGILTREERAQQYDNTAHGISIGDKAIWLGLGAAAASPAAYSFARLGEVAERAAGVFDLAVGEVELFAPLLAI